MKGKVILFSILILLTIVLLYSYWSTKIQYNPEGTVGNTSGNLLNGGLVCEFKDKIYFSNPNDDGALYVMDNDLTHFKKLHDDKITHINIAGKYLFYNRNNNEKENVTREFFLFRNTGIYRMNLNGKGLKCLNPDQTSDISLAGNNIYFQHNSDDGQQLYQVGINGAKDALLLNEPISPHAILGKTLYYTNVNNDHYIKSMDLTSGTVKILYKGNCSSCIVTDQYIYYLSNEDNYAIGRVDLDGSNPTIIVEDRCFTFNLSTDGKYLYYQVDGGDHNGIHMMNLETTETTVILEGDYNHISTTKNYVFFQKFNSNETFILKTGGEETVASFNPPVLKN